MTGSNEVPGVDGAIMRRMSPGGQTVNTIDVPNLDDYVKRVKKAGGKTVTERATIPGVGHFCYCADTEGNVFGIMQDDPKAK